MIKFTKKDRRSNLEKEIDNLLVRLNVLDPGSDSYAVVADNLERLYKAKSYEKIRFVSPDTVAVIAGNLLGIVLILNYEKLNVVTSKAIGFVVKGRV